MANLLEKGFLKKIDTASPCSDIPSKLLSFEMEFLQPDAIPDLLSLQGSIAASLPSPEIFVLHDVEYYRDVFSLERSVIGVITEEGLIAYSIIRIPGLADDNLGKDLDLLEKELLKVAHLQAVAVHPAYRGNGLQRKLAAADIQVIKDMGYQHVCCTVSPKNPISLTNMLSCGFEIKRLVSKENGWYRYVLHRDISTITF